DCGVSACSNPKSAGGYCSAHYHRLRRYGDPLGAPSRGPSALDILAPVIGDELAAAVVAVREGRGRAKRFDAYRASLTLEVFQRASDPKLSAWEYIHRDANRQNLTQEYLLACFDYDAETGLFRGRLPSCTREEGDVLGSLGGHGYLSVSVAGR